MLQLRAEREVDLPAAYLAGYRARQTVRGAAANGSTDQLALLSDELPIGDTTKSVNIRTHIRRGDIIKIEGISGSGKSSFVRLLLKFRSCDRILFNGIDIRQLSNQVIRARVKYIPQEPVIFPFSIADNIALGSNNHHKLNSLANNRILMPVLMRKSLDTVLLDAVDRKSVV